MSKLLKILNFECICYKRMFILCLNLLIINATIGMTQIRVSTCHHVDRFNWINGNLEYVMYGKLSLAFMCAYLQNKCILLLLVC